MPNEDQIFSQHVMIDNQNTHICVLLFFKFFCIVTGKVFQSDEAAYGMGVL
jgi:hypothetical protein